MSDTVHSVHLNGSDANYEWIFSMRRADKGADLWFSSSDGTFDNLNIQIPATVRLKNLYATFLMGHESADSQTNR